jgi:phosphoribosyl 1,2-cyclic phosphate phosphodiesterase
MRLLHGDGPLMKFTLLGSGTSTGVPLPGCTCKVCTSKHPRNHRDRTSACFTLDDGRVILIDAGPDLRYQALKQNVGRVDSVLFTHPHADHILGIDDLRSFNFISKKRISCYGSAATIDAITAGFSYIFNPRSGYQGGMVAQLDPHKVENDETCLIEGIAFDLFPLIHGDITVTGFRVGDVGYATDFNIFPERAERVLQGVKHLFIDGLRYEPHPTHITITDAVEIAQRLKAERTYIIHTTHTIDYDEVNATLPPGIELGYDGLTIQCE